MRKYIYQLNLIWSEVKIWLRVWNRSHHIQHIYVYVFSNKNILSDSFFHRLNNNQSIECYNKLYVIVRGRQKEQKIWLKEHLTINSPFIYHSFPSFCVLLLNGCSNKSKLIRIRIWSKIITPNIVAVAFGRRRRSDCEPIKNGIIIVWGQDQYMNCAYTMCLFWCDNIVKRRCTFIFATSSIVKTLFISFILTHCYFLLNFIVISIYILRFYGIITIFFAFHDVPESVY